MGHGEGSAGGSAGSVALIKSSYGGLRVVLFYFSSLFVLRYTLTLHDRGGFTPFSFLQQ